MKFSFLIKISSNLSYSCIISKILYKNLASLIIKLAVNNLLFARGKSRDLCILTLVCKAGYSKRWINYPTKYALDRESAVSFISFPKGILMIN